MDLQGFRSSGPHQGIIKSTLDSYQCSGAMFACLSLACLMLFGVAFTSLRLKPYVILALFLCPVASLRLCFWLSLYIFAYTLVVLFVLVRSFVSRSAT